MTSPSTLLLGGGYTLQHAAQRLPLESFVLTSRSEEQCKRFRSLGYQAAQVDTMDKESLEKVFSQYPSIEMVIDSVPPLHNNEDPLLGVKNLLSVMNRRRTQKVIYLSTTGVFSGDKGEWVDESSPLLPPDHRGRIRIESEELYRTSGIESVTLRLPAIYGPGRGIVESIRRGQYFLVGEGERWSNRIHVFDIVQVLQKISIALRKRVSLAPVFCLSDDVPLQAKEVASLISKKLGLPYPSSISEEEALERGAVTLLSNRRVKNALIKASLSLSLEVPSLQFALDHAEDYLYSGSKKV